MLELEPAGGEGVLHITAQAASCDAEARERPAYRLPRRTGASRSGSSTVAEGRLEIPKGGLDGPE